MKTKSYVKTIKTVCGKTITFLQEGNSIAKMHSTEGPAIIYPAEEKKTPEYYLYGVKYSKPRWKEMLSQNKVTSLLDTVNLDLQY